MILVQPVDEVASALRVSIGLLVRRLRQVPVDGELTLSETSALARMDRGGPTTATRLAKLEQISPQSMGATLAALESRGLVARCPDPADGRRATISVTDAGRDLLRTRRDTRTQVLAQALAAGFTPAELAQLMAAAPLIERLAESL
jgi:DNA-binding MarR family transcriptional regulator